MLAPRLRHRVTLQAQVQAQNAVTGAAEISYVDWLVDEPAEFVFLSGSEFIKAQTTQVQVEARVTLRWRAGVDTAMRMNFDGVVYQLTAVLPDSSARRWLTVLVKALDPSAEN